MSIYAPEVLARARRDGITDLQAWRIIKAERMFNKNPYFRPTYLDRLGRLV